jgi:hypothetical protein
MHTYIFDTYIHGRHDPCRLGYPCRLADGEEAAVPLDVDLGVVAEV